MANIYDNIESKFVNGLQDLITDVKPNKIMKKMIQWVLVATLTCGASVFTACSSNYTITAHLKKVE